MNVCVLNSFHIFDSTVDLEAFQLKIVSRSNFMAIIVLLETYALEYWIKMVSRAGSNRIPKLNITRYIYTWRAPCWSLVGVVV